MGVAAVDIIVKVDIRAVLAPLAGNALPIEAHNAMQIVSSRTHCFILEIDRSNSLIRILNPPLCNVAECRERGCLE